MNLYLHIEMLEREFQSKLLIAMESASRGINVYMGRVKPYLLRNFFVPGIILDKSITPSPHRIKEMEYCKKKNFIYSSLDEEVGLLDTNTNYLNERYSNQTLELVDNVFCWGKFDYNNLCKKFKKYKKKFIISGNPRLDFWRQDLNFFFEKKKLKHKNYILFSTNFGYQTSNAEFKKFLKLLVKWKYTKRGLTIEWVKKQRKDSTKMFKHFSRLITTLANKTDLRIIVRPHPTEQIKNYNFLKKYKNVSVIKKGSISEWIYYAKIVIHSGCTGGFESSVRGRPTISYIPFNSSHGHEYANSFSQKANNLNECIKFVQKLTKNDFKIKKTVFKKFHLRAHNLFSKKPGYKTIVDKFIKLQKMKKISKKNNDLVLKLKFKLRDLRSKLLNYKYGTIKFSTFDKYESLRIFEILKQQNPKYNNLSIDFIKKDIIQIKNND
jgi:surface carbohydrate biosynthesis protein